MAEKKQVADHLVERLRDWGVESVYGFAGDGINTILGAFTRVEGAPNFIAVAHEELASLAATAHAKFTGHVTVCMSTQGPGAIHLLNGVYDAKLDHQPVVAIVGQYSQAGLGGSMQQEADLKLLFRDACPEYCEIVSSPEQLRHVVDRAFRIASTKRSPVCIIIPHNVQKEDAVEDPPHEHGHEHSSIGFPQGKPVPSSEEIARAAAILNAGSRVAILAGAGAIDARNELIDVANMLDAGIAKALLGKAAVPDDLPFVTGSIGWLGTEASDRMVQSCDTLLLVGTGFPYPEFLPEEGRARAVQIDTNAAQLGIRYPTEVNLLGDAAATLRSLLPLLKKNVARKAWRTQVESWTSEWYERIEQESLLEARMLNPQLLVQRMSAMLPDNALLTADSGTSAVWYARHLRIRGDMVASLSGTLATMGCALPYGFAGKYAFDDRPVIALSGDGAMQMLGNAALIDISRRWREWRDPRFVIVVLNNRDLGYVTWEQRAMEGLPRVDITQDVPDFEYARYAEMLGLRGVRVDSPEQVEEALRMAFSSDRPFVIDAVVDPAIPTLPPRLREEQKEMLAKALQGGDSDGAEVRKQVRERYPRVGV